MLYIFHPPANFKDTERNELELATLWVILVGSMIACLQVWDFGGKEWDSEGRKQRNMLRKIHKRTREASQRDGGPVTRF